MSYQIILVVFIMWIYFRNKLTTIQKAVMNSMAIFQFKSFLGILLDHGTTCMILFSSQLSGEMSLSKWLSIGTYSLLISIHIARTPSQVSSTVGLIWLTGNINPPCPPLRPGRSSSPYAYLISAFMIKWIKTIFNCELYYFQQGSHM